ncbi:MAG TPA: ATPase, T2SS/T4P/T4SS family [Pirellulales bacterium]|nr:ATPase, T2SS/T4P/T4SS family [Pirellulales bacterium]
MRLVVLLLGTAAVWAASAGMTFAAEALPWPDNGVPFDHGPGYYLSLWKMAPIWLLFAMWVYTTDWVNRDTYALRLEHAKWNSIVVMPFFWAYVLVWVIPWFWLAFPLLVSAYAAPLTMYVRERNSRVAIGDQVLTRRHIRKWMQAKMVLLRLRKPEAEGPAGPDVNFKAQGAASDSDNNVNLLTARENMGFLPARHLVADALQRRATNVLLEYTAEGVQVRHQIDGVWHDQPPLDRELVGDPVLEVFKTLAALDPEDRRTKQVGTLAIETSQNKYSCRITTQGTQTGERALLQIEGKKLAFKTLEELGMRQKMVDQLMEILARKDGMFAFTSLPAGGLSTTIDVALGSVDRFTRNFSTVQDIASAEREILNVPITTYSAAAGETPATVLPKLVRTYPDVIVVRELVNKETLELLVEQAGQERLILVSLRSKDAIEALVRLLQLKVSPVVLAPVMAGVLNVRLVRKLCENCREAYPPPPEVLKQMGVPAGRIESFFRPPTQPLDPKHPEVVCDQCQGIGYLGRTAIFELLAIDEGTREVLGTHPKLELLRAAARKGGHRTLQDEGLLLVARGVTSLQELLRVLKQ